MIRFLLLVLLASPAFASEEVIVHHNWGKLGTVYQYGRYYVAAAPDQAALQEFKNEQGGLVVDLRGVKDLDCSSREAATHMGLPYKNVPIEVGTGFKSQSILQVEKVLNEAPTQKPILLACKTGNRAAAVLAIHLMKTEHLSATQAEKRAESLGLKSPELKVKLEKYLSTL